jgi:adenylate cyclase
LDTLLHESSAMTQQRGSRATAQWMEDLGNLSVVDRLCRFVPSPVVEAILGDRMEEIFRPHQREVVVVFLDLRGFTAFVEATPLDEVARVLRGYHRLVGENVLAHGGTLERFTGDGTMVFFGDRSPRADAAVARAVSMALAMRTGFCGLQRRWRGHGRALGLGIGVSKGPATAGIIGFDGRWDYGVIGPVTNLAARLCQLARPGEILVCQRAAAENWRRRGCERVSEVRVKGLPRKVEVYRL